jgi:hypothetical protein
MVKIAEHSAKPMGRNDTCYFLCLLLVTLGQFSRSCERHREQLHTHTQENEPGALAHVLISAPRVTREVIMEPRPRLYGPTATVTLAVYLMPEGHVSHYEIIGKSIEGAQTYFRAQASRHVFPSDAAFVEMVAHLGGVVSVACRELRDVYGVQQTIEDAPTD